MLLGVPFCFYLLTRVVTEKQGRSVVKKKKIRSGMKFELSDTGIWYYWLKTFTEITCTTFFNLENCTKSLLKHRLDSHVEYVKKEKATYDW